MTMIDTSVGPAAVLHRLALAVEVRDPLTVRLALTPLRAGREVVRRTPTTDRRWPCAPLDAGGPARFKLRHAHKDARLALEMGGGDFAALVEGLLERAEADGRSEQDYSAVAAT